MEPIPHRNRPCVACDVRAITTPTEPALDALARLQLAARRLGATIELHNASPALADLIAIAGLADVLVVVDSGERCGEGRDGAATGPPSGHASRCNGRPKSAKSSGSTKKSCAVMAPSDTVST